MIAHSYSENQLVEPPTKRLLEFTAVGKGDLGNGKPDRPNHTTCSGRQLWEYPTYSAF
jgi:hypothetical protein